MMVNSKKKISLSERIKMANERNHTILSVFCNGIEYRCKQYEVEVYDGDMMRQSLIWDTRRSSWYSKDGKELDDKMAMKLLAEQNLDKEKKEAEKVKNELISKLWDLNDRFLR